MSVSKVTQKPKTVMLVLAFISLVSMVGFTIVS